MGKLLFWPHNGTRGEVKEFPALLICPEGGIKSWAWPPTTAVPHAAWNHVPLLPGLRRTAATIMFSFFWHGPFGSDWSGRVSRGHLTGRCQLWDFFILFFGGGGLDHAAALSRSRTGATVDAALVFSLLRLPVKSPSMTQEDRGCQDQPMMSWERKWVGA